MKTHCDHIRPELKLSGGFEEEIDLSVVKNSFRKYGIEPYKVSLYVEYVEFFGWLKNKTIGYIKLEDFDLMVNQLIKLIKPEDEYSEDE